MPRNNGKYFEKKTHSLISKLNPNKQVLHNIRIKGKLSESKRQLDVILRSPDEYDFIAFECKDEKASVGTPTVEAYNTKLRDVGAKHGAIVSNSPFSRGARRMADKLKIDLLNLVDTNDEAIKTKLLMRSGLVNQRVKQWHIGFEQKPPYNFPFDTPDYGELVVKLLSGESISIKELANKVWGEMADSVSEGSITRQIVELKLVTPDTEIALPSMLMTFEIDNQYRIGQMDVTESEGMYNVQDGSYQTSNMAVGPFGDYIFQSWKVVSKGELESAGLDVVLTTRSDLASSHVASYK